MKAIKASKIFNGLYTEYDKVMIWNDGVIVDIVESTDKYDITEFYETDCMVAPGFVDLQVNGAGGANFYKGGINEDTLKTMSYTLLGLGCTAFCPTLISSSDEDINKALDLVNAADMPNLIGLHIEGPMFAKEFRGAHSEEIIRVIQSVLLDKITKSRVSVVTLAPETVPDEYITKLQDAGIRVSIGHTAASLEEIRHAECLGVGMATHLYNAMSRFQSRESNTVGAILTSESIYASIIPDGNHTDFNAVRLAHKALGDRLFVVTDAILALGTDLTEFEHSNQKVFVDKDKRCVNESGALVGSMISPVECIQNLVEYCGFTLEEALKAYTYTPAKVLNIRCGKLVKGSPANFLILDTKDISLKKVYFEQK